MQAGGGRSLEHHEWRPPTATSGRLAQAVIKPARQGIASGARLNRWCRRGLLALALAGCSASTTAGPKPEATLADSHAAQEAFRGLHERWVATAPGARSGLEGELIAFVQTYPTDPKSRLARLYLAWLTLRRGDEVDAQRWLDLATRESPGTADDLAGVIRGALLLRAGHAAEAYDVLGSLAGQLIDKDDRLLCLDELVSAALAAKRYDAAVGHMLELAALAARRHRERVWRTLEPRLASVPITTLEQSLDTLGKGSAPSEVVSASEYAAARAWMRGLIRDLLSRSALVERDVNLAQRLVAAPRVGERATDADTELMLLATQAPTLAHIDGRTLGLVLDLTSPVARERSVQVAAGVAAALNAPRSIAVELRSRVLNTGDAGLKDALERLVGEGAGVLLAGVEPDSAAAALEFARARSVPLLLLHEPRLARDAALGPYAFVAGSDAELPNELLRRQLVGQGVDPLVRVGSGAAPCPRGPAEPLGPGFAPVRDTSAKKAGLFFEAGARCARDVLMQLEDTPSVVVGLGLEALAVAVDGPRARELWSVGAGILPLLDPPASPPLKAWLAEKGSPPSFYEALGHDAARFARAGLEQIDPGKRDGESEPVGLVYQRVRGGLASATLDELWTTEARSFTEQRLPRAFRTLRLGRAEGATPRRPAGP